MKHLADALDDIPSPAFGETKVYRRKPQEDTIDTVLDDLLETITCMGDVDSININRDLAYPIVARAIQAERDKTKWKPIASAPRDGSYVWLWNKHVSHPWEAPQPYRWSTHYSVFGLGGCWTDGLCTMGDGIDFDFWCAVLPAQWDNPYEDISGAPHSPSPEQGEQT